MGTYVLRSSTDGIRPETEHIERHVRRSPQSPSDAPAIQRADVWGGERRVFVLSWSSAPLGEVIKMRDAYDTTKGGAITLKYKPVSGGAQVFARFVAPLKIRRKNANLYEMTAEIVETEVT